MTTTAAPVRMKRAALVAIRLALAFVDAIADHEAGDAIAGSVGNMIGGPGPESLTTLGTTEQRLVHNRRSQKPGLLASLIEALKKRHSKKSASEPTTHRV